MISRVIEQFERMFKFLAFVVALMLLYVGAVLCNLGEEDLMRIRITEGGNKNLDETASIYERLGDESLEEQEERLFMSRTGPSIIASISGHCFNFNDTEHDDFSVCMFRNASYYTNKRHRIREERDETSIGKYAGWTKWETSIVIVNDTAPATADTSSNGSGNGNAPTNGDRDSGNTMSSSSGSGTAGQSGPGISPLGSGSGNVSSPPPLSSSKSTLSLVHSYEDGYYCSRGTMYNTIVEFVCLDDNNNNNIINNVNNIDAMELEETEIIDTGTGDKNGVLSAKGATMTTTVTEKETEEETKTSSSSGEVGAVGPTDTEVEGGADASTSDASTSGVSVTGELSTTSTTGSTSSTGATEPLPPGGVHVDIPLSAAFVDEKDEKVSESASTTTTATTNMLDPLVKRDEMLARCARSSRNKRHGHRHRHGHGQGHGQGEGEGTDMRVVGVDTDSPIPALGQDQVLINSDSPIPDGFGICDVQRGSFQTSTPARSGKEEPPRALRSWQPDEDGCTYLVTFRIPVECSFLTQLGESLSMETPVQNVIAQAMATSLLSLSTSDQDQDEDEDESKDDEKEEEKGKGKGNEEEEEEEEERTMEPELQVLQWISWGIGFEDLIMPSVVPKAVGGLDTDTDINDDNERTCSSAAASSKEKEGCAAPTSSSTSCINFRIKEECEKCEVCSCCEELAALKAQMLREDDDDIVFY